MANQAALRAETKRHNLELENDKDKAQGDPAYARDFSEYKEFLTVNATKQREDRERAPKKRNDDTGEVETSIGAYRQPPDFKSWRDSQNKVYPGRRVTLKSGQTGTVTKVYPDGRFDLD